MKRVSKNNKHQAIDLANYEIVVLAAYLVGAHYRYVDTEDIAIKANEIAPGRFSWRKYKHQINIDTVRKRLWDATKKDGGYHERFFRVDDYVVGDARKLKVERAKNAFANEPDFVDAIQAIAKFVRDK